MYAYIQGIFTVKTPTHVIIDVNGIGFEIHISLQTYTQIQDLDEGRLYTYYHVKEDIQALYGFAKEDEKVLFKQLISVSGIGPNTARMILSSLSANELVNAILLEQVHIIQGVKGIGPKSAKRLILELKDKVATDLEASSLSSSQHNTLNDEALSALVMLGFSKAAAGKAIDKALKESDATLNVEDLIKQALNNL